MRYLFIISVSVLCFSCNHTEYIDSHKVNGSEIKIVSEGEVYNHSLNYFKLVEEPRTESDSIFIEDEVKTANIGFNPVEHIKTISSVKYGNYTVRRCLYRTAFEVIISSWVGSNRRNRCIPIHFEAEEIWLNGELILEQPYVFENINTEITEIAPDEGITEIVGKYLLEFQIVAHNRYFEYKSEPFSCYYNVARLNKSDVFVSPDDITITVTYDWHPD